MRENGRGLKAYFANGVKSFELTVDKAGKRQNLVITERSRGVVGLDPLWRRGFVHITKGC